LIGGRAEKKPELVKESEGKLPLDKAKPATEVATGGKGGKKTVELHPRRLRKKGGDREVNKASPGQKIEGHAGIQKTQKAYGSTKKKTRREEGWRITTKAPQKNLRKGVGKDTRK